MRALAEILDSFRTWVQPPDGSNPFKLVCRVEPGASRDELEAAESRFLRHPELVALWSASREALLFKDIAYGQWGLHLLTPANSGLRTSTEHRDRPNEFRVDDVVIGEFLGDSELVVFAPSETGERRCLVALPLDSRDNWFAIGSSLVDMFERYLATDGEKFWEGRA